MAKSISKRITCTKEGNFVESYISIELLRPYSNSCQTQKVAKYQAGIIFLLNHVTYPDFWLHFIAMQFYGCNNSLQLSNSHTPGLKLNCHIFTDTRTSTILQLKHQTMSNSLVRLTQTDFATRALKVHQALEFPAVA